MIITLPFPNHLIIANVSIPSTRFQCCPCRCPFFKFTLPFVCLFRLIMNVLNAGGLKLYVKFAFLWLLEPAKLEYYSRGLVVDAVWTRELMLLHSRNDYKLTTKQHPDLNLISDQVRTK